MASNENLKKFEDIYNKTYNDVLKFIICKCFNIDDVNDIIQEVYIEVYKKVINNDNIQDVPKYIMGIAKNKVRKHYRLLQNIKRISLFSTDDFEILDNVPDKIDILKNVLDKSDIDFIWQFLKGKKLIIQKVFYLYYGLDFTIKEIALKLNKNESTIKSYLYRTLKELQNLKGGE